MIRILFIATRIISFREKDLEILRSYSDVDVFTGKLNPLAFITTIRMVLRNDIVFSWFVTKRAFFFVLLSKLFRRKYVLVSGGNDAIEVPEIGYTFGVINKLIVKLTLSLSDRVLAFSDSSKKSILELAPKANVETIYVGAIDTEKFKPDDEKEDLVMTVGHVSWSNIQRKGLKTFVQTAKYLPAKKFTLIGEWDDDSITYLKSIDSPNVIFTGYLPFQQLLDYYKKAKVYVQVSAHEGFGISIAEAMSCGCIPVVTRRGAIPEVVGNTGYYVPYDDARATAMAIDIALKDTEKGEKARERIRQLFTLERRERELRNVIEALSRRAYDAER